jgi:hypothetical protein
VQQNVPQGGYYPYPPQYYYPPQPVANSKMPKEAVRNIRNRELEKVVPSKKGNSLGSLQIRPHALFATQNPSEKVYILARRHWVSNTSWIFSNTMYSILFPIVVVISDFFIDFPSTPVAYRVYLTLGVAFYSIIFTNIVRHFFDWYFDPYIVTNERVLDYRFNPFVNYSVEEAPLESIESVKQKTRGFLGTIFNYGDIVISTEANTEAIKFEAISNPTKIRDIISDLAKIARTFGYGGD